MRKYYLILLAHFYSLFVLLSGCTENPFSKDETISGNRVIRGKVELNDGVIPNNIHVWLESMDVSSRTDDKGDFQLTLPPPLKQLGGGLNGVYKLYFFVANYGLDSAKVLIRNGHVEYSQHDIDERGGLRENPCLFKLLDITTTVSPSTVTANFSDTISISLTLQAIRDAVYVTLPKMNLDVPKGRKDLLSAIFMKKVNSNENLVNKIHNGGEVERDYKIGNIPQQWLLNFIYEKGMFAPGDYQAIPYLLIQHRYLPRGLLKSLGEGIEDFGADYLNIPLKQKGGEFHVLSNH